MEDTRCCGTGTCIINAEGYCWCGQRWNGERMCFPERAPDHPADEQPAPPHATPGATAIHPPTGARHPAA